MALIVIALVPPFIDAEQSDLIMHAVAIRTAAGWTAPIIHNDLGAGPLE